MMQLLLDLSWFLLGLSVVLSVTVTMTMLLRSERPAVAFWTSWLSLALSCVAAIAVMFTIGYTAMILHYTHDDEAPCAAFGLKKSPHSTHTVPTEHPKVNASAVAVFWMAFTEKCPLLERLLRWIAVGLCMGAIVSFVVVLIVISRDRRATSYKIKRFRFEFAHNLKNKSPACEDYKRMKTPMTITNTSSSAGMKRRTDQQYLLRDLWASYASLGIFCASLLGVILLDHYCDLIKHEITKEKCVPLDYVPLKLGSNGNIGHDRTTGGLESLRSPFHIVSRKEWMAKPPKDTRPLQHPVSHVVLSHTPLGSCSSNEDCIAAIHCIQEINMGPSGGLWDISTNFLIARDGRAYEGRGWNTTADDTGFYANGSLRIMFSGTSLHTKPTINQRKAFEGLIDEGVRVEYIAKAYEIVVSPKSKRSGLKKLTGKFSSITV